MKRVLLCFVGLFLLVLFSRGIRYTRERSERSYNVIVIRMSHTKILAIHLNLNLSHMRCDVICGMLTAACDITRMALANYNPYVYTLWMTKFEEKKKMAKPSNDHMILMNKRKRTHTHTQNDSVRTENC